MSQRILLVDDDPNVLQGYKRQLRKRFDLDTALSGPAGLEAIEQRGPYAVVVSDMRMPVMDGVQFLSKVRDTARDTVRMMLTGNSDQQTAMDAVNEGHIFRFLNKPCPPETFAATLEQGLEQHRLITAERELLSKTLAGSVKLLGDVLALAKPKAYGHSSGVRQIVRGICQEMQVSNSWQLEVASMVCQIGCVSVSELTLEKIAHNQPLTEAELQAYERHAKVGHDLLAKIPRLEGVAEIILYQNKRYDGSGFPNDALQGDAIPLGARILKLAIDFEMLRSRRGDPEALTVIHDRRGWYDPAVVEALTVMSGTSHTIKSVAVNKLTSGMVLDEHVTTLGGDILIASGQTISAVMCQRLTTFAATAKGVREPIRVRCPIGVNA